jgi:hypothetical protein
MAAMAPLSEAYDSVNKRANDQDNYENPQTFDRLAYEVVHPKAARHMLGLVGGNEVQLGLHGGKHSDAWASMTDIESDLRGTTRPNTECATRKHLPNSGSLIVRKNPKQNVVIETKTTPLNDAQFWAYPSVVGPKPFKNETCIKPEKF